MTIEVGIFRGAISPYLVFMAVWPLLSVSGQVWPLNPDSVWHVWPFYLYRDWPLVALNPYSSTVLYI